MTAAPDDHQPEQPAQPPVDTNQEEWWLAADEDGPDGCLTAEEIAELSREQWDAADADFWCAEDPEAGPPELPASEWARLQAEDAQRSADSVPEAFDAGFNRHCGGKPGNGFAAGGPLDAMLPGSDLAWHVGQARRDLAGLDDDQLVGVMIGGQKLEAWASQIKLATAAELDRRRTARDGQDNQKAPEEIGAALTLTPRSADILAGHAGELERLPQIEALLANGIIDGPRAKVITRYTAPLSDEEAAAVEDVIAQRAGELNAGRLAACCDAAIKAVDPAAAKRRKEKALRNARVEAWSEPDGTAALAGRDLPPAQVIAVDKSLDADAKWLRDHGTDGSWDELRALAYLCRLNRQPLETLLPQPAPAAAPNGAAAAGAQATPALGGTVNLTMPLTAWQGLSDRPGEVAGFGAADADTCRDLATRMQTTGRATKWCITLVDREGRAVGHGCARAGPGPPGSDPRSWLATVKIHKIQASSCDHEHQSAGYQPSPTLRNLIKTRSRRCGYPGCGRPAVCCDDDHTIPYHLGGRTCQCNLHPLCRRHHRAKQAPGWHLDQPRPGTLIWTLPSGRRYTSAADPYPV
jgi:hypothetical protein